MFSRVDGLSASARFAGKLSPLIDVCDDYRHGRKEEEGEFKSPENASSLGSDFSGIFAPGEEESKGSIGNI